MLPPVSEPSAATYWWAATAAADPPDEPPGTRVASQGLVVTCLFVVPPPQCLRSAVSADCCVGSGRALQGPQGGVAWNGLGRRRDRSAISACGILEGSVYGRVWGRVSLFVGDSDVRQTRGRNELSELVSDVSEDTDGAVGMILPHVGIGTHGRWHRDRATCDALDVEDSPDTQSPLW